MAYFLRFGLDDRVDLDSEIRLLAGDTVTIDVGSISDVAKFRYLLDAKDDQDRCFILLRNNRVLQFNTSVISNLQIDGTSYPNRSAEGYNLLTDGNRHQVTITISSPCDIGRIGARSGTGLEFIEQMDLYSLTVSRSSSPINNYDPSASNGTGQILPDTVGGNDGALVNFPTDDSQWVFYVDGGGVVTADAAYTIAAPTFASTASATLPAPIAGASFALASPTFSAAADASLPQPTANGAFSIASPQFSVNAEVSLPQPVASAAFTLNSPTFSASATATIPGFSASVAYSVNAPTFSTDATVTLPSPTTDVDYTVTAPTFSVDSTATLPQPTADTAFSLPAPTFAATATVTEPNFNAAVDFTVSAPTFSGSASATLPQPVADANFTVLAPTFSVVAIVGGIAIIVDEETNINQRVLSNNINAPILSTNING